MTEKSLSNLMPSEAEIRAMLSQIAQEDIGKLPAAMLQIQIARLVSIMLMKISKKVSEEADELQKSIDKARGKSPDNDVPK